jgi:hypothetical protein
MDQFFKRPRFDRIPTSMDVFIYLAAIEWRMCLADALVGFEFSGKSFGCNLKMTVTNWLGCTVHV